MSQNERIRKCDEIYSLAELKWKARERLSIFRLRQDRRDVTKEETPPNSEEIIDSIEKSFRENILPLWEIWERQRVYPRW